MSSNSVTSTAREHVFPLFVKYVSANVLGMIGYSCYILADTFFVARGIGSDAIAAGSRKNNTSNNSRIIPGCLQFLPAFSLLNGTGLMIGMGAAARYSLSSGRADSEIHRTIFTQALQLAFIAMLFFFSIGLFFARPLCVLLGADGTTLPHAIPYISILLMFSPLFLCNNLLNCFVRNDGEPRLSMTAMLVGSLTNIVLDYIFIYPMQLGMTGAALATATAPLVGMSILSMHFWKKKNQFHLVKTRIHLKTAIDICRLGVSSLVAELSSGIVILVFNMLTLKFSGTTGLAAYSILANIALVLVAIFTGIGQGIQPIVSSHPGKNGAPVRYQVRRYALSTALLMAFIAYLVVFVFAVPIADLFNKDKNPLLTSMAAEGMRIYFVSLFFSGINMVSATYLSASDQPVPGFIISILRGLVLILPIAFLLAALLGMTGIWLCLPVTEAIVCVVTFFFLRKF